MLVEQASFQVDDVRSVALLFSADGRRMLLLRRADWKSFAPGRWTGIGGRLEGAEVADPSRGALRELQEETGLTLADLGAWQFVADVLDPGAEVRLVYFTGVFSQEVLPPCSEGTLHWVPLTEYGRYDLIENTRVVLDALLARGLPGVLAADGASTGRVSAGGTPAGGVSADTMLPLRGRIEREDGGRVLRLVLLGSG